MRSLIFLFLALTLSSCFNKNNSAPTTDDLPTVPGNILDDDALGTVNIQVTGTPEAQAAFERGLLLLHSFEYDDARAAFQEAQEADSTMAMAYWGEAMTHNHPLWRQQEPEEARTALARLAPSAEERRTMAKTPLERDFLTAVDRLFAEEGTKQERDQA